MDLTNLQVQEHYRVIDLWKYLIYSKITKPLYDLTKTDAKTKQGCI